MPSPSSSVATLRPDLATFMEFDLEMQDRGYIGTRVLPIMDVMKQSGSFGKIPIEQLLQGADTKRAPGGGYNRGNWKFETATYACEENGWEEPVDDRESRLYSEYFEALQVSTMRAYENVLRNQEKRIASLVFNATTFSGQTTNVTNEWDSNHKTDAVPIDNVETAVRAVADRTGIWPNALIINRTVFRNLRNLDQIVDRISSSGAGNASKPSDITPQMLASVFDLDFVIVAGNYENTAKEGQDASLSQIWSSEYAFVTKVATTNDMREPCLGRTFHWAEDGSQPGGTVETYRDETVRGDVVRVRHDTDEKLLYTEVGQLLDNVTTI